MKTISLKNSLLILAIVSTFAVTFFIKLSIERAAKKPEKLSASKATVSNIKIAYNTH